MKRFVIEIANEKKRDIKRMREVYVGFTENLRDEKTVSKEIDNYVKACKIGFITEIEAVEAICKISLWLGGNKA